MKIHKVEQGTAEWHQVRCARFTASTFKDVFMKETTAGYKNAIYKVAFEILTGEIPDSFSNEWMARGTELEKDARIFYEMHTCNKVEQVGFVEMSKYIGCSPDGLVGSDGLVEIKCPKYSTLIEYLLTQKVPKIYEWQIQGQMMVTGRKWCDFVAYHPNIDPLIIRVERDEEMIKQLQEKLDECILKVKDIVKKLRRKK